MARVTFFVEAVKLLRVTCDLSAILDFAEKNKKRFLRQISQDQWEYPKDQIWAA